MDPGAVQDSTGFALVGVVAVSPVGAPVAASAAPGHASSATTPRAARRKGSRILTMGSIGLPEDQLDMSRRGTSQALDAPPAAVLRGASSRGAATGRRRPPPAPWD